MASELQLEFAPIKTKRVLDLVVTTLEESILSGKLKDGDMLPSEEQLATQLGVGRRAVREALKVLETKGLVQVQMGVGTVVRRTDLDSFLDSLSRNVSSYLHVNRAQAQHVMELRLLLEGAALEHLATHPDPARFAALHNHVAEQRKCLAARDFQAYQEWHFRFHNDIVDTLHNPIISMLYRQVMTLMRGPMERAGALPARTTKTINEHEQIVRATEAGEIAEMRHVLRLHLEGFFVNVQADGDGNAAETVQIDGDGDAAENAPAPMKATASGDGADWQEV